MNDRRLIQRMSLYACAYARMKSGGFQYILCRYPEDLSEGDGEIVCIDWSGVSYSLDPGMVHSVFVTGTSNGMSLLIDELEEVLSRGGSVCAVWNEQGKMPSRLSLQDVMLLKRWRRGHRVTDFDYVIAEFKLGAWNG